MSDSSTSFADKNADATNFAPEQPRNPTPNSRSRYEKKALDLEKSFVQRFFKGNEVQVSGGRGVGPTIYTIESIKDGKVTLRVRDGSDVLITTESKLRKVS